MWLHNAASRLMRLFWSVSHHGFSMSCDETADMVDDAGDIGNMAGGEEGCAVGRMTVGEEDIVVGVFVGDVLALDTDVLDGLITLPDDAVDVGRCRCSSHTTRMG